jgi:hypothetical protein
MKLGTINLTAIKKGWYFLTILLENNTSLVKKVLVN